MGNVPDGVTDADLAEYFGDIGEVDTAQLRGNDGSHYGFVEFRDPAKVHEVLSLAEQQPFMMGDHHLRVQPRWQKEQTKVSQNTSGSKLDSKLPWYIVFDIRYEVTKQCRLYALHICVIHSSNGSDAVAGASYSRLPCKWIL